MDSQDTRKITALTTFGVAAGIQYTLMANSGSRILWPLIATTWLLGSAAFWLIYELFLGNSKPATRWVTYVSSVLLTFAIFSNVLEDQYRHDYQKTPKVAEVIANISMECRPAKRFDPPTSHYYSIGFHAEEGASATIGDVVTNDGQKLSEFPESASKDVYRCVIANDGKEVLNNLTIRFKGRYYTVERTENGLAQGLPMSAERFYNYEAAILRPGLENAHVFYAFSVHPHLYGRIDLPTEAAFRLGSEQIWRQAPISAPTHMGMMGLSFMPFVKTSGNRPDQDAKDRLKVKVP